MLVWSERKPEALLEALKRQTPSDRTLLLGSAPAVLPPTKWILILPKARIDERRSSQDRGFEDALRFMVALYLMRKICVPTLAATKK